MKIVRNAVTAVALCAMATNTAWAAASCASPAEQMALKTAAVQQQLMVAAFMCHDADAYNRFVTAYQGELQQSDAQLKAFFVRRDGKRTGEADYDTYKTKVANMYGLSEARDDRAFCALAGQLFANALANQAPLAAFVAAAPSTPDFADVCLHKLQADRVRNPVHVAQGPASPGQ